MKWDRTFMHGQMDFMNHKVLGDYNAILLIMIVHLQRTNLNLISYDR